MKSMAKLIVVMMFFISAMASAADGGWTDLGVTVYSSGGLYSPGYTSNYTDHYLSGVSNTTVGTSQVNVRVQTNGFATLPTSSIPSGTTEPFASFYGTVSAGGYASHSLDGTFNSNWLTSTANASATNGGSASMYVNGSTSSGNFPPPPPTPVGGKGEVKG